MDFPNEFETDVVFKLGSLYDVTVHLLSSNEETDEEIIEQAMDMLYLDVGINIKEICDSLNISPYDSKWVTIHQKGAPNEPYHVIQCVSCERKVKKPIQEHASVLDNLCSLCAESVYSS